MLWPNLRSLQAPCLTYRVDASGAVKSSGLTLLSPMGELPVSVLQTQGALPLQPIPFHVLKIRRPVCPTNQLGGVFECLLEASWACATKKLLDAEGHLAGPAENPLRASGQRTLTKAMSTGHIFVGFIGCTREEGSGDGFGFGAGRAEGLQREQTMSFSTSCLRPFVTQRPLSGGLCWSTEAVSLPSTPPLP